MRTYIFRALTVPWAVSGICDPAETVGLPPWSAQVPLGALCSKKPVIAILGRPAGGPAGPEGFDQGVRAEKKPAICPSAHH